jgi:hypothetical protein
MIDRISVAHAARRADVSKDTVQRWCRQYGIGKQLAPHSPWRVDPLGLIIVMNGDGDALEAYRAGNMTASAIKPYITAI